MQLLNANVLLEVILEEKNIHKETGIDLGQEVTKNEKFLKGKVIAFGELVPEKDGKPIIEAGDVILFDNNRASNKTIDGVLHKIILFGDAIMIL